MVGERIENMKDADYRAADGVSCSKLKSIYAGGCAAFGLLTDGKTSAALAQGAALHIATTRPEAYSSKYTGPFCCVCHPGEVVVCPDVKGYGSRTTKKYEEFAKGRPDQVVILRSEMHLVEVCSRAARTHPKIAKFLEKGTPEVSYFAHNDEFGTPVKCRVDWEKFGGDWCIDFKFMAAGNEKDWRYASRKFGYYIQDAYYRHVISLVRGDVPKRFTFVVIDKDLALRLDADKLPVEWAVAIYEHEDVDLDRGAEAWRHALGQWMEYLEAKEAGMAWAGFPDKAQKVRVTWGD